MKTVTFHRIVIALSIVALFFMGQIISKANQTPEAARQPDLIRKQAEPVREQLINRVIQPYNRMVYLCDYLAQFSYLVPDAGLPSACAQMRAAGSEAIARIKTMKDLNLLSRQVDNFEITIAPELRMMEASYATARRIMAK